MRVTVRNLGPIEEAEIELKPLTILVGPNNAGKTWLTSILPGILGTYGWRKYLDAYLDGNVSETYPVLDTLIQNIFDNGNAVIDLVQFADEQGEQYINHAAQFSKNWLQEFLSTERISFDDLEVHISLEETKRLFLEHIQQASMNERLSVGRVTDKPLLRAMKQPGEQKLYFYTTENIAEKLPPRAVREFALGIILRGLHRAFYPGIRTFPAERTTFIAIQEEKRLTEEDFLPSENEESTFEELRSKSLSVPVKSFLNMISVLQHSSLSRREKTAKNDQSIARYMQLSVVLEQQVLGGKLDYSTSEPDTTREILFTTTTTGVVSMEIPAVSSMVKELSPLVLYLRYLAKSGELLVIDEPEMNLHPEAQVKIIEFLAMLVNAGLPVLITTQSPYVVDQVINLMEAYKHSEEEKDNLASLFFLQQKEAFIAQSDVAVYLVDEGVVENILDEDGVIHWSTFSDVNEQVQRIHLSL